MTHDILFCARQFRSEVNLQPLLEFACTMAASELAQNVAQYMTTSLYASKVNHMAIRPFYQATDMDRPTLKERWDFVIHERSFNLESYIDTAILQVLYPTVSKLSCIFQSTPDLSNHLHGNPQFWKFLQP